MNVSDHQRDEVKEVHELLALAQKRMSGLIRSLPIGIAIVRADGMMETGNDAFLDLLGYQAADIQGKNISMILYSPPWTEGTRLSDWHLANPNRVLELEARSKSDEIIPIDFSIRQYDTDKHDRLVVVIQDVTERFLANNLKHDLYQMINHDIRSPLTNVVLFLKLMEARTECGTLTDFGRERLMAAQKNIERIINLADGLLEIDKLESSDSLTKEPFETKRLIQEAIAGVTEVAAAKGIELLREVDEVSVEGNFPRLLQVLINLMSNAISHSAANKPILVRAKQQSSILRFSIQDHGPGVPDNEKPLIFDRFKQGARKTAGGHGLGLAICKQIVSHHAGTIGCDDAPGGGSIFWFEIPIKAQS